MKTITGLNWGVLEIFFLIITAFIGFAVTYLLMPFIIKYMKKTGNIGVDIHKNSKPEVAESGGVGILAGALVTLLLLMLFFPIFLKDLIIIILTVLLAGLIGFIDDRIRLRSRYKISLTLFIGLLVFIANYVGFITFDDPTLPILGKMRLSILFPVLIPLIITVFANTVNMLEGYNGEGSGTVLIALGFLAVSSIILNSAEGLLYSVVFFSIIFAFFFFNKYPAKTFPGDIGTLTMGVMVAVIALFGNLLFIAFCTLLLHVFNSFLYISSVRGFFESKEIHRLRDDIMLLQDDRIKASEQKGALMTIPRLILSKGPLKEDELVKRFFILTFFCGFLAIFSAILISYTTGVIDIMLVFFLGAIMTVPLALILFYFKKVSGAGLIILLIYILLVIILLIIDYIVIPYFPGVFNFIFIKIPVNMLISVLLVIPVLIIWYFLTNYYFWSQIRKKGKKRAQNQAALEKKG